MAHDFLDLGRDTLPIGDDGLKQSTTDDLSQRGFYHLVESPRQRHVRVSSK
jgi:hypothetical protein